MGLLSPDSKFDSWWPGQKLVGVHIVSNKQLSRDLLIVFVIFVVTLIGLHTLANAYSSDQLMKSAQERGGRADKIVKQLQVLLPELAAADDSRMREVVNKFYNTNISYATDMMIYDLIDYWASPLESAALGRGDCEDYAIAKYFTLLAAGMPMDKLRMVYVKVERPFGSEGHMVLAYYPDPVSEPLILDNIIGDILPAGKRNDLKPVFSFNSAGLWRGFEGPGAGDPMLRISKWRDVVERTKKEGF